MRVIRAAKAPRAIGDVKPAALILARLIAAADRSWTSRALCAQADPDMFFSDSKSETAQAKEICGKCDVCAECLTYALDSGERHGVWGGLDAEERRRLVRRRNAPSSRSPDTA